MKIDEFIAHRGANQVAPENTMVAFEEAYRLGMRWIELDVQLSKDGKLFIFHDINAKRLTNIDVNISDCTWSCIQKFKIINNLSTDKKSLGIASLKEYLTWMSIKPGLHTNIELKISANLDARYELYLAESVLNLLDKYPQLHRRILLSSFSDYILSQLVLLDCSIDRAMLLEVKDWNCIAEAKFFDTVKDKFNRWKCVALGINNSSSLNSQRMFKLKEKFKHILVYSIKVLSNAEVFKLLLKGADSVFVDNMSILQEKKYVGFLATGNEIITGDVINTNIPQIAENLYKNGLRIGMHVSCSDNKNNLKKSLKFLLEEHKVVIVVGGLGPTEDDKTCESIAEFLGKSLDFNEDSWSRICKRILSFSKTVSSNNKKQAFFPKGSEVLINTKGTADGCYISTENQHIFMLPGPPHECWLMFKTEVLPRLLKMKLHTEKMHYQWQLLGASEASVAEILNPLSSKYHIELGYRAAYPYLEVKLHVPKSTYVSPLVKEITEKVKPFLVTITKDTASKLLARYLKIGNIKINMQKDATKGYVYSHLMQLMSKVKSEPVLTLNLYTDGMFYFWNKNHQKKQFSDNFFLRIKVYNHVKNKSVEKNVHVSFKDEGKCSFVFIYEWICAKVLHIIQAEEI